MRHEARWFWRAAGILWIFGLAYLAWSYTQTHRPEVGLVALGASGLTAAMIGGYVLLVARRIAPRPEDRPDAEVADGAGVVGFFGPGSYWPVAVALGCTVAVLGLALVAVWLIVLG